MSDKFLRIARKEILEELEGLHKVLSSCSNDNDISNNGNSIEKHLHKIKGLAPMMEQNDVGEIAKMTDTILKHIITKGTLIGTYQIFIESNYVMKEIFNGTSTVNVTEFKNKLRQTFPDLLDH